MGTSIAKRNDWERNIRQQQKSGLSEAAFCRRAGLSTSSFSYWKRKLTTADDDEGFVQLGCDPPRSTAVTEMSLELPFGIRLHIRGIQ